MLFPSFKTLSFINTSYVFNTRREVKWVRWIIKVILVEALQITYNLDSIIENHAAQYLLIRPEDIKSHQASAVLSLFDFTLFSVVFLILTNYSHFLTQITSFLLNSSFLCFQSCLSKSISSSFLFFTSYFLYDIRKSFLNCSLWGLSFHP